MKKQSLQTILKIGFLVFISFFKFPLLSEAQPATINASLSAAEIKANGDIEITFSVGSAVDAYFFSLETIYDSNKLQFIEVSNKGLTDGGISIADNLSENRIGASVSRTNSLETPSSGDLMVLLFRAKTDVLPGLESFTFEEVTLSDSSGEDIDTDGPVQQTFGITESISDVDLKTPAVVEVTEGDTYEAAGRVFAAGITDDAVNSGRTTVWIGVSEVNTDPTGWNENVWQQMDFSASVDGYFEFTSEIAHMRQVGTYYLALRAELDTEMEQKYGGRGGFWNQNDNPSSELTIDPQPPFRYTLAEWDFDDERLNVTNAIPQNEDAVFEIMGAGLSSFSSGASGQAANANGWTFDTEIDKYWQITVDTEGFESLMISSKQLGSNTGPRDFQLQISTDGGINWSDVSGGTITVANNWTTGVLNSVALPGSAKNQSELSIRWLVTSDTRVDGSEGISGAGTNRIDDVKITGLFTGAVRVDVWPGDTNSDGVVNADDLLPLSVNWLEEGPKPVYPSIAWAPREVESWVRNSAEFADADGDGRVDQNDLQPIGLNFGKSQNPGKIIMKEPIAELTMERLTEGEMQTIYLYTEDPVELSGIAAGFLMNNLNPNSWRIIDISATEWADEWVESNKLIDFLVNEKNKIEVAKAHKGRITPRKTQNLLQITIRAESDWTVNPVFSLNRLTKISGNTYKPLVGAVLSTEIGVSIDEWEPDKPVQTELYQNYPNPFNPVTTIRFTLAEPADLTIEVFNSIGKRVAIIHREISAAGEYQIPFDGSALASGVYYYQLRANDQIMTRSMTLIK